VSDIFETINTCRICHSIKITEVMDLGSQPPANSLYESIRPPSVPLRLLFCEACSTVQLGENIDPDYLFSEYLWITGTSETALNYSKDFAKKALKNFNSNTRDLSIVEIASNDGTFLKEFQKIGCKVLGIDPAVNIAEIASKEGIPTQANFFSKTLAEELLSENGPSDLIYARNVIPHVKEVHSVISGIETLLSNDGIGIIEFHNAGLLVQEMHYDYIYHEHLFYYTLTTIEALLKRYELNIFDVSISPISGGSWVVYFSKNTREKTSDLINIINSESEIEYNNIEAWINFSKNAKKHSEELTNIVLNQVKVHGKIVAYGASARSSTLLNYCGICSEHISVVIDKNPLKHGLMTAGSEIPIVSYEDGLSYIEDSNTILLLAWNFKDEIIQDLRQSGYKGEFIVPLPGNPYIA
jgi:SAM-dependent methyltransferase